jgi:hypothetical protein
MSATACAPSSARALIEAAKHQETSLRRSTNSGHAWTPIKKACVCTKSLRSVVLSCKSSLIDKQCSAHVWMRRRCASSKPSRAWRSFQIAFDDILQSLQLPWYESTTRTSWPALFPPALPVAMGAPKRPRGQSHILALKSGRSIELSSALASLAFAGCRREIRQARCAAPASQ